MTDGDNVVAIDRVARRREQLRVGKQKHDAKRRAEVAKVGFPGVCDLCGVVFKAAVRGLRVCGPGVCLQHPLGRTRLKPFTVRHFKLWASFVVLDTDEPWVVEWFQEAFLRDVFAGVPEVWKLIAEGNTKTTSLAGLGLYHMQFREYGRVPVAAASKDQAFELHLQAQGMVERSDVLRPVFSCHEGTKEIKCASRFSRMKIYASDDRTGDGAIFTLALVDELHRHKDLRLYRTWAGKRQKRGGQLCGISTAGEPGSDFEETRTRIRQTALKVSRKGRCYARYEGPQVVLHEFAVPQDADCQDLRLVKQANPFSGITVESLSAKRDQPTMVDSHWRRFTCNLATRGDGAAVSEAEWFEQGLDFEFPVGVPVAAGLDVAWKWDTTALVPLWIPEARDFELDLFPLHLRRWLGERFGWVLDEQGRRSSVPDCLGGVFRLLGAATILEPPRDNTSLDPDLVEQAIVGLNSRNPVHTVVMDTSKAEQLATWIKRELGVEVVDRQQSNPLHALDYERWMEALRERWLFHCKDPGLSSHVLNAVTRVLENDRVRFDRPRQSRQVTGEAARRRVIDGLTAAAMVHTDQVADLGGASAGVVYG